MFKWQAIDQCNSIHIEFRPNDSFGIDETSQFYATSYLDTSEFADIAQNSQLREKQLFAISRNKGT